MDFVVDNDVVLAMNARCLTPVDVQPELAQTTTEVEVVRWCYYKLTDTLKRWNTSS